MAIDPNMVLTWLTNLVVAKDPNLPPLVWAGAVAVGGIVLGKFAGRIIGLIVGYGMAAAGILVAARMLGVG